MKNVRKELIQERVNKLGTDISTLKENRKNLTEIINDFNDIAFNSDEFKAKYSRLDLSLEEVIYYRRLINKQIKILKEVV